MADFIEEKWGKEVLYASEDFFEAVSSQDWNKAKELYDLIEALPSEQQS